MTAAHDHTDPHPTLADNADSPGEFEVLEMALREMAIERGRFSAADHRQWLEWMDAATPALGARLVARAWVDPDYKQRALDDGTAAAQEIGIDMYDGAHLIVMENTPDTHNVVVCTLCSCYPRPVLGLPPDWYKSPSYRRRMVRWPRAVLAEFGTDVSANVNIRVHDSNANMRYLILPMRPSGTDEWSEEQLASIVTRDVMIGVTVPDSNRTAAPTGQQRRT